jgi:N6-adenosine-specific RNA methylase IME4
MEFHPAAVLFPLLDDAALKPLVDSMRAHGFDPSKPVLRYLGAVLDGRNRLRAASLAGVGVVFADVVDECDPYLESWKHNGARRDLDPDQKAAIYMKLLAASDAWAKEREAAKRKANAARTGRPKKIAVESKASREAPPIKPVDPAPRADAGKTSKAIAEQAGVSRATVERVQRLERESPAKFEQVARGEAKANKVLQELKTEAKHALAAELNSRPLPAVTGRFSVIAIDPPWKYDTDITRKIASPYPEMDLAQICALPVGASAQEDCVLWLWTTNTFMRQAFDCLDAWGFVHKTILTWTKNRMGTGDWLRGKTEHCLMAARGKPLITLTNQTTSLLADVREHSRKPDEFYSLVEALCPGSKLEFFSREPRQGWVSWGAETQKFSVSDKTQDSPAA